MLHFTMISRQSDALALSADTDNSGGPDMERNKVVAKNIIRKLSGPANANGPALLTVEHSNFAFHLLFDSGVLFLTMCDSSSPALIAYSFLEDVAREFLQQYGNSVASATRPYLFIKFDLYLQKTKSVRVDDILVEECVGTAEAGAAAAGEEVLPGCDGPPGGKRGQQQRRRRRWWLQLERKR